jgi:hypothetical protein
MWTTVKRSGTEEFPLPRDLFVGLLSRLVEGKHVEGWVHFELEKRNGWFSRLFAGMEDMVEVALTADAFKLNKGRVEMPLPETWSRGKNGTVEVPLEDQEILVGWIDRYFRPLLAASPHYTVKGWLDGL